MNEADIPFEQSSSSFKESVDPSYRTPLMDYKEGNGVLISPRSILRMRVERAEICWLM